MSSHLSAERFTDDARRVISFASAEAREHKRPVGTGDLLIALVLVDSELREKLQKNFSFVDLQRLVDIVLEEQGCRGPSLSLTSAMVAVSLSLQDLAATTGRRIEKTDILRAILAIEDTTARRVLSRIDVTPEQVL